MTGCYYSDCAQAVRGGRVFSTDHTGRSQSILENRWWASGLFHQCAPDLSSLGELPLVAGTFNKAALLEILAVASVRQCS